MTPIPPDVRAILERSAVSGNVLMLPGQLDRVTYLKVDKVLRGLGGRWDRKVQGHVFPYPPADLLGRSLENGTYVDRKKELQFFATPPELARRMVDMAAIGPGANVLEPSAGHGAIVQAILAGCAVPRITAIDIDAMNCAVLREIARTVNDGALSVHHGDFLDVAARPQHNGVFAAIVMNPPFADGQDIAHITAAVPLLARGGRLVAIAAEGPFFRRDRKAQAFRDLLDSLGATTEKLPRGTFRDAGTDVATRLIYVKMPA